MMFTLFVFFVSDEEAHRENMEDKNKEGQQQNEKEYPLSRVYSLYIYIGQAIGVSWLHESKIRV